MIFQNKHFSRKDKKATVSVILDKHLKLTIYLKTLTFSVKMHRRFEKIIQIEEGVGENIPSDAET
ncbi:hypothetical protein AKJ63_01805 [candidate division MSBL1 archaeon SCGC-AAA259D18]|uniref:Uncharacterized protein n=1 Tax=candidate division MSBL1 archaeon SCGC-AAA259D18 TaxID=1698262 RepID=A0A133UAH9_9EURY|nr:hypothetical protein AKJ63_01805 [candidate division MSBL1 archaeon SCGC-AAA259D18]